jgi:hypothetical protein
MSMPGVSDTSTGQPPDLRALFSMFGNGENASHLFTLTNLNTSCRFDLNPLLFIFWLFKNMQACRYRDALSPEPV